MMSFKQQGLDDLAKLDLYPTPDHRPVSSFFLGCLFIACLQCIAMSLLSSSLLARILSTGRRSSTFRTLEDDPEHRIKSSTGLATRKNARNRRSVVGFFAGNMSTIIAILLAISSLAQMASLLALPESGGYVGCVSWIFVGGLFGRLAGLVALLSLNQDLHQLSTTDLEHRAFVGFVAIAFVASCLEQGFSTPIITAVPSLPFRFCTRQPSITFCSINSTINILGSTYALARMFASVLPTSIAGSDLRRTAMDLRVARCLSVLLLNVLTFVPEIMGLGVIGYIVPFVVSSLLVLVLFDRCRVPISTPAAEAPQPYLVRPPTRQLSKSSTGTMDKRVSLEVAMTIPKNGIASEAAETLKAQYVELYTMARSPSTISSPSTSESPQEQKQLKDLSRLSAGINLAVVHELPSPVSAGDSPKSHATALPVPMPSSPPKDSSQAMLASSLKPKFRRNRNPTTPSASIPSTPTVTSAASSSRGTSPQPSIADVESAQSDTLRPKPASPRAPSPVGHPGLTHRRIVSHISSLIPPSPVYSSPHGTPLPSPSKPIARPRVHIPSSPQRTRSIATTVRSARSARPLSFLADQNPNPMPSSPTSTAMTEWYDTADGRTTPWAARSDRGSRVVSGTDDEFIPSGSADPSSANPNRLSGSGTLQRSSTAGTEWTRRTTTTTSKRSRKEERVARDRSMGKRTFGIPSRSGTLSSKNSSSNHQRMTSQSSAGGQTQAEEVPPLPVDRGRWWGRSPAENRLANAVPEDVGPTRPSIGDTIREVDMDNVSDSLHHIPPLPPLPSLLDTGWTQWTTQHTQFT